MKKLYFAIAILCISFGCSKKEEIGNNPYAGGKEPFGIAFSSKKPEPNEGRPGETIRFQVKGLQQYEGDFTFSFNEMPAEIEALTDSTIDVIVPELVSSGGVSIRYKDQVFFGPHFNIESNIRLDTDFGVVNNGFSASLFDIYKESDGFLIGGSFDDFEDEASEDNPINSIHYLNSLGESGSDFSFEKGATGSISSIDKAPNGKYYVSGDLTLFNDREVNRITRLNANGSLDTVEVDVLNPTPEKPENGKDTVATFNGGSMSGSIIKVFATSDNGVIGVGNFDMYERIDYKLSSRDNRHSLLTQAKGLIKFKEDGSIDSTYNVGNSGANGQIMDAARLNDGRIILVGSFTRFNGEQANRIVCIGTDGEVDPSFDIGDGADKTIMSIRYNKDLNKIAIAGIFDTYKGQATEGVILMDTDGIVDDTFVLSDLGQGSANFAQVLNSGKVLVTGTFEEYQGVKRSNLLILEENGEALQEYNTLGNFSGQINKVVETTSSMGYPALLIGGSFRTIDGKKVGNIAKIELRN